MCNIFVIIMSLCLKSRSVRIYNSDLKILRTTFRDALIKVEPKLQGMNLTDPYLLKRALEYAL